MSADQILFWKMEELLQAAERWGILVEPPGAAPVLAPALALKGETGHGSWIILLACQLLNARGDAGK